MPAVNGLQFKFGFFWWSVRWGSVALPFAVSVDPRWKEMSFQIGPVLLGYCWVTHND